LRTQASACLRRLGMTTLHTPHSPREMRGGYQAGDGRTTGMVGAQYLTQEHPKRDQGRVNSVHPERLDRCQCLRDDLLREDVGAWQISVLKILPSQDSDLLPKPSLVRITHSRGLRLMGLLPKNHLPKRGLFAYVSSSQGLAENYVPFVTSTDAPKRPAGAMQKPFRSRRKIPSNPRVDRAKVAHPCSPDGAGADGTRACENTVVWRVGQTRRLYLPTFS
jgi:hypothetical protein